MLLTFLLKTFKNSFTCSVHISRKIFTASVYSLKDFIVYFSMYFSVPFDVERFALYYTFFCLSTLFRHFFQKVFSPFFRQNKKLVIDVFILFIK